MAPLATQLLKSENWEPSLLFLPLTFVSSPYQDSESNSCQTAWGQVLILTLLLNG